MHSIVSERQEVDLSTDLEIIRLIRQGNKDLYAEIIRRYHDRVHRHCFGMLGSLDKAEDAAQESFIKAYKSLDKFREESAFSTWLYRLTSNHCLDVLRGQSRQRTESLDALMEAQADRLEQLLASQGSPNETDPADRELIETVLSQLKPDYRLILSMREIQHLSYQEMADALNTSLDSVKAKLKRARKEMSDRLRHFLSAKNV